MAGTGQTYRHALIVGKFAPLHAGHQQLIEVALAETAQLTILVYSNPDFTAMPQAMRAGWLRTLYPQVTVLEPGDPPADEASDTEHRVYVKAFLKTHGLNIDVVYTSEDYGDGFAEVLGVRHRRVATIRNLMTDETGQAAPLTGTAIRAEPYRWRRYMPEQVYAHFIHRIVLLGAESTGKSTLTKVLAQRFNTQYVAEYGREVYEARSGKLELADYVDIATGHRRLEDLALAECRGYQFCDTNAFTTLFFSHYYNRDSLPELRRLADACCERYNLVIVCDDDIPFEQDGWRDNSVWRGRMQGMVLHDLRVRGIDFHIVSGTLDARLEQVANLLPPIIDLQKRGN